MMIITLSIIWAIYSILEGFREGFYWWFRTHSGRTEGFNMHIPFTLQRGILFLVVLLSSKFDISLLIYMPFSFSFLHNGSYYLTRSWISKRNGELNPYPGGFFDQSNTSESVWTSIMTPTNRTILFILGIFSLILFNI